MAMRRAASLLVQRFGLLGDGAAQAAAMGQGAVGSLLPAR